MASWENGIDRCKVLKVMSTLISIDNFWLIGGRSYRDAMELNPIIQRNVGWNEYQYIKHMIQRKSECYYHRSYTENYRMG